MVMIIITTIMLITHHHRVVVRALKAENDSGVIASPVAGHVNLSVVPDPAHEVPQCAVLCDVIETGRHRHRDDGP